MKASPTVLANVCQDKAFTRPTRTVGATSTSSSPDVIVRAARAIIRKATVRAEIGTIFSSRSTRGIDECRLDP